MSISQKLMDKRYGKGVGLENLNVPNESEQRLINARAARAEFSKTGSKADLYNSGAESVTDVQPAYGSALGSAGQMVGQAGAGGGPLIDASSMALSGAGVGAVAGAPGALIGAGVGAGLGLYGGLARSRIERRKAEAEARRQSLQNIANIEQQRGMNQQAALANIMSSLRGTFGGI